MAKVVGAGLRLLTTLIRLLEFLCALAIVGIFAYFIGLLHHNGADVPRTTQAVEGLAGGTALWTALAFLLTCCVGGAAIFGILALILDILCIGAMVAVAVLTRGSVTTCNPLGSADATGPVTQYGSSTDRTCKLEKSVFALAIALIGLLLLSMLFQCLTTAHHKKDKHLNNNDTTYATEKKAPFYKRNKNTTRDAEYNAPDMRPSHDSRLTENTVVPPTTGTAYNKKERNSYVDNREPTVPAIETQASNGRVIAANRNVGEGYGQAWQNPELASSEAYRQGGNPNLGYNTAQAANAAFEGNTSYNRNY